MAKLHISSDKKVTNFKVILVEPPIEDDRSQNFVLLNEFELRNKRK